MAKEKFIQLAAIYNGEVKTDTIILDAKTRWNSTFHMMERLVSLSPTVDAFVSFLSTPEGRKEFSRKVLPTIGAEKWALVEGINILLRQFDDVTNMLSGEKYPTLAYAYPYLCWMLYECLNKEELFEEGSCGCPGKMKKEILLFQQKYKNETFYRNVIHKVQLIQKELSQLFIDRFSSLDLDLIWIPILDPRMRQLSHMNDEGKEQSKQTLVEEASKLTLPSTNQHIIDQVDTNTAGGDFSMMFDDADLLSATNDNYDLALAEVELYLNKNMKVAHQSDALDWCHRNNTSHHLLAFLHFDQKLSNLQEQHSYLLAYLYKLL